MAIQTPRAAVFSVIFLVVLIFSLALIPSNHNYKSLETTLSSVRRLPWSFRQISTNDRPESFDGFAKGDGPQPNHFRHSEASPLRLHSDPPKAHFSHVYVISLASRKDRREQMTKLANALELNITFIDAMPSANPTMTYVAEQVYEVRRQKAKVLADVAKGKARGKEELVGGMGIGSIWLARDGQQSASGETLRVPPMADWVSDVFSAVESGQRLHPQNPDFDASAKLFDPIERIPSRQLNAAVLSTYLSHVETWRTLLRNGDSSALILEDDVDIEFDFTSRWNSIEKTLPTDWQVVFAGHCWGKEMTCTFWCSQLVKPWAEEGLTDPTGLHPHLFHANIPRCLHGYVMSDQGARALLPYAVDPFSAFQAPIDVLLPTLLLSEPLPIFSIDPPLIVQAKDMSSDLQPGTGSKWRGLLGDSTLDRIWRDEGKEVKQITWDEAWQDPAVNRPHIKGQHWR